MNEQNIAGLLLTTNTQSISSYLLLIGFVAFFYLVVLRPQNKQRREWEKMITALKRGQAVITKGGIHGIITDIRDNVIRLQIADKVEITVSRSAVAEMENGKREVKDKEAPEGKRK